ncbi:MAG: HAMP domain-containing protein [Nitrospirae bacterium]|nr:HAMP domain-containing protein [Nitrospirota bacterium]
MRWPIRRSLFAATGAVVVIALVATGVLVERTVERQAREAIRNNLEYQARLLSVVFAGTLAASPEIASIQPIALSLGATQETRMTVMAPDGRVLGESFKRIEEVGRIENHLDRPEIQQALREGVGQAIRVSETVGIPLLYVAVPVPARPAGGRQEGRLVGIVRVALPLTRIQEQISQIRWIGGSILAAALAIALLISWVVARRLTRPITEMVAGAQALTAGRLEDRLLVRPGDELTQLADSFNQMAETLARRVQDLTEERSRLEGMLASMVEGVMALDARGRVLLVNRAWEAMFASVAGIHGRHYLEVIRSEPLRTLVEEVLGRCESMGREVTIGTPQERQFLVQASATSACKEGGICAVFVFHDVSDQKRLERVRKDFVANVSHELRTPLTAVRGYVEALLDGAKDDPAKCQEFLAIIEKHAGQLQNLVEDLLELSRLESEGRALPRAHVDLRQVIARTVDLIQSQAERQGDRLDVEVSSGFSVLGNDEQLRRVLMNLIDNALKYSPFGARVRVRVEQALPPPVTAGYTAWTSAGWPEPAREGILLRVEDQGAGIPPEDLPRVSERFYRVDKARSRELGGTGLGLAIVKHIVEIHHGGLRIESRPGRGTVVTVWLPSHPIT